MQDFSSFFNSLPLPTDCYDKYSRCSLKYNLGYRKFTRENLYGSPFPFHINDLVDSSEYCIAIPHRYGDKIVGISIRSFPEKSFRHYSTSKLPYGSLLQNKEFNKPWLIVESQLDSDLLRQIYPYVIANSGVTISNNYMDFYMGTSQSLIIGSDNDDAGNKFYYTLRKRFPEYSFVRFMPPFGYKDFGDLLDLIGFDDVQFELGMFYIKSYLENL